MKHISFFAVMAVFLGCFGQAVAGADSDTALNEAVILQKLVPDNPKQVIGNLPEIEKLWPSNPLSYFRISGKATGVLAADINTPASKQALITLFTNALQKPIPKNTEVAGECLELKCALALDYLNLSETRNEQAYLAVLAKFVGEIRSRKLPNYARQGVLNPVGIGDSTPEKVKQAVELNNRRLAEDRFQSALASADTKMTFHLLHNVRQLLMKDRAADGFVSKIVSIASLTKAEESQLK